ncbi:MAG: hypothetical protein IJ721_06585 [Bacteroidales bacterium]|nr:hypothetical protein [Bacteroidales bacterium]
MKRLTFILTLFLLVAGTASAQRRQPDVNLGINGGRPGDYYVNPAIGDNLELELHRGFTDAIGISVYGSRYRKAKEKLFWSNTCIAASIPAACAGAYGFGYGLSEDEPGWMVVGAVAVAAGTVGNVLGFKWHRQARRELDDMLDDFVRNYGPKPRTSAGFGGTRNGVGFSINF